MATNVYIKHNNEISKEELKYIEDLKTVFSNKYNAIKEEENKIKKYETLSTKLESIHKKLSYDLLVPVSQYTNTNVPLCFIPGKLVHTNEVFAPLGGAYYTKLTNIDGISQCNRRIEDIKENIIELENEKKVFLEKITFLQQSALQPGQVEIIEEYSEPIEGPLTRRRARGASTSKAKVENSTTTSA